MSTITKSQLQFVRSLQSRKVRDQLGLFIAEGPKVIAELLNAPRIQVQDVFATERWAGENADLVRRAGGSLIVVNDQTLGRISSLSGANGVVAIFTKPDFAPVVYAGSTPQFSLLLDAIQDPGNLGTILRCADWFGIQQVICNSSCADAFNAKVIQASMGSIARVQVSYEDELCQFLEHTRGDAPVYAATLTGENLYHEPPAAAGFLIIGNESRGIAPGLLALASRQITIPRHGGAESLNAAVATGILLSHLRR